MKTYELINNENGSVDIIYYYIDFEETKESYIDKDGNIIGEIRQGYILKVK